MGNDKPIYQKCFDCCIKKLIEVRAQEISEWREDYNIEGDDLSDWLEAEKEVMLLVLNKQKNEKETKDKEE